MTMLRTKREPCRECAGRGYHVVASRGSLRKVRKNAGLGLRQFASLVCLSPSYICDVECGRRRATERIIAMYRRLELRSSVESYL